MISNTVTMILNKDEVYRTKALTQGDYGQRLIFKGYDLPGIYEVHFSNEPEGESKKYTGDSSGVKIPDEFLVSGKPIFVWVFMHHALDDGKTVFRGYIPVTKKALPTDEPVTPVEQSQFEQMIAALERETNRIPMQINTALQEAKDSGEFDGPKGDPGDPGFSPEIDVTVIPGGHRVVVRDAYHVYGFDIMDGTDGNDGNGIASAVLNSDYTLTLTFTNGTSYTTPSIRGLDGQPGAVFIPSIDENGVLRWTNNGGLPNPDPVSLAVDLSSYAKKTELAEKLDASQKGIAGGVAELDQNGKVPSGQLPAFTSDYEDLTHKPSIGGVTLSGDKTLHQLGIAAESDIPAVPTKTSELVNDSGFLTQETDPTVADWAKQPTKPSYTAQEVGALPANTQIPRKTSDLTNDSGFLTQETDPTVADWAKQPTKPTYTAQEIGAYEKPAGGIPETDLAAGVIPDVSGFYTKPANGIPATDLAPGVVPDVQTKADKVQNATDNNFAALDANGNLKDSGHKHSDYTTAEIVSVSSTQPTDSGNKLWIKPDAEEEYTVPSYAEHQALLNALSKSSENTSIAISAHAVGDLFWYNGTLHIATSAIAVGDTIVDTGSGANCKDTTISEALIKDIQVNGTSILQNGVANVPLAAFQQPGVASVNLDYGIYITNGLLYINRASSALIKGGNTNYRPIVPSFQHESIFYGLSKLAGVDLASGSDVVGVYPDAAKVAIQKMLGIYQAPWEIIRIDTFTNATEANHTITVDGNGQAFELTDVIVFIMFPGQSTPASVGDSGRIRLYFTDTDYKHVFVNAFSQEANAAAKTAFAKAVQNNKLLEMSSVVGTANSNRGGIVLSMRDITSSSYENYAAYAVLDEPITFKKVLIPAVTGTCKYAILGKRKWTA